MRIDICRWARGMVIFGNNSCMWDIWAGPVVCRIGVSEYEDRQL